MSRTRSILGQLAYYSSETNFNTVYYDVVSESMVEQVYPGSTPVSHSKIIPGSVEWKFPTGSPFAGQTGGMSGCISPNNLGFVSYLDSSYFEKFNTFSNSLNFRSLDSSSKASLIQTLAELDESLLIFTRRFWEQLNYGAFTWGVVPFVSDVKNWASTVSIAFNRLRSNEDSLRYKQKTNFPHVVNLSANNFTLKTEVDTELHRSGSYFLTGLNAQLEWLDRLGFHPDIATAYDLVPFSFVLDYFLPIGKFLTDTFQRGWVNEIDFTGWGSVKRTFKFSIGNGPYWASAGGSFGLVTFDRHAESSVLHTEPVRFDIPGFELPTLQQIFNTQYLAYITKFGQSPIKRPRKTIPLGKVSR